MKRSLGFLLLGPMLACQQPDPTLKNKPEPTTEATQNIPQGPVAFARLGRFELKEWEFFLSIQMATDMLSKQGAKPEDLEKYKDEIRERSKEATIEGFVISAVLAREAERRGEKASVEEINAERTKQFKERKPPANTSEADLSTVIERNLLANRMVKLLEADVSLTDEEAEQVYRDALTEVEVEYVMISPPTDSTPEAISAYTKAHTAEIKAYYDANTKDFILPEAVKVSHILIKLPEGTTDQEEEALKQKIEDIAAKIANGTKFAEAAKQFSEDVSSKESGGALGWLSRGQLVKKFEEIAFSLQPGQISKPLKTSLGFHLINVEERRAAKPQDLATVEAEIAAILLKNDNQAVQAQAQKVIEQLTAGKKLSLIAASFTPTSEVKKTGVFSMGQKAIPGLGSDPALVAAIHGLTLAKPFPEAPLAMGQAFVVPVLLSIKEPDMKPFAENKTQIKESVLGSRKKEKSQTWIKKARKEEAPYFEVNRKTLPQWKL
jgi:parvulin-like peptidyl-prolyl isomerase